MSKALIEDLKKILFKLKKEDKITNKFRIYLEGYLAALFHEGLITLKEANDLRDAAETEKADPFGVGELFAFGDIEDYKNSKLEFD